MCVSIFFMIYVQTNVHFSGCYEKVVKKIAQQVEKNSLEMFRVGFMCLDLRHELEVEGLKMD